MRAIIFITILMVILPGCIGYSISNRYIAPRCRTVCFQSGFKRVNEVAPTPMSKKEIKIKNDKLNEPCGCRSTKVKFRSPFLTHSLLITHYYSLYFTSPTHALIYSRIYSLTYFQRVTKTVAI